MLPTAGRVGRIVVAGPNGTLGQPVIKHLLNAGFHVTALTRDVEKVRSTWPSIDAILGDYSSAESLAQSLQTSPEPFDSVVSLLNRDQLEAQLMLLDAVVLAKVPHIVPSEFGFDVVGQEIRSWPWLSAKVAMQDHLFKLADDGHLTYTAIHVGAFFDWALERGILVNLLDNGQPIMTFDGGNRQFDVTTVDTIGRAVAAALVKHMGHPEEVRNRFLHVHNAAVTQQELLGYAREIAPHREFKAVDLDTAKLYKMGLQRWQNGERGIEINRLMQPRAFSNVGPGHFKELDNEYLGIEEWSQKQVQDYIAEFIASHSGP